QPDALTTAQAAHCARRMARFRPAHDPLIAQSDAAPLAWTTLAGIGDPAHLDPAAAWRPRTAAMHLRVPIGISDDGAAVELDIKEAAQNGMGPHGLCVGATGSGKSEFLRTLTLGMMATHPPEVLNLVL